MNGLFPVENNNTRSAVNALLTKVMESGAVDALLVPLRHPAGDAVTPALVKNPALLMEADPFAPVLPVNGARLAQYADPALAAPTHRGRVAHLRDSGACRAGQVAAGQRRGPDHHRRGLHGHV